MMDCGNFLLIATEKKKSIVALLVGSTDHRERGAVFQVNIFSGNFCVNKSWMMPLNSCENVSLAIVLELQAE